MLVSGAKTFKVEDLFASHQRVSGFPEIEGLTSGDVWETSGEVQRSPAEV